MSAVTTPPSVVIERRRSYSLRLDELWAYRELFYFLMWRDVKVRYKQTALGAAWAVLQPLLLMVVFTIFLGQLAGVGPPGIPYPVFAFSALVPWMFFSNGLAASANSLVGSSSLVSKIYFPRILTPVAAACSFLLDFAISFVVLLVLMAGYGLLPSARFFLVPVFAAYVVAVAIGAGLLLSALNVRYRDVRYALPFLIQLWLFATPVAYQFDVVGSQYQLIFALNPMVTGIEGFRAALIGSGGVPIEVLLISTASAILLVVGGFLYFRRVELDLRGLDLMEPVVHAEGLGKRYVLGASVGGYSRLTEDVGNAFGRLFGRRAREPVALSAREIWALKDVSLEIQEGAIVGVVGRNGAGKSTLLKVLARITEPTEGRAVIRGRVGSLLEVGTGFHPELTGRENVFLNGAILGMRRTEIREKFDDIVSFAELERFIDTPVKRYSSGMYVRLAFAVAAFLEPEILFIDEVLSVGDQAFQQRCLGRMGEIAHSGRTILFVSHNLAAVAALCTRAILIDGGRLLADGDVDDVITHYLSSVQAASGDRLDDRQDRHGDGRLRVVRADVVGAGGGPVRTGDDAVVRLDYESEANGGEVVASIAVEGPMGEPVFFASNRVTGQSLRFRGSSGEISCVLPRLPLLEGRYALTVHVSVNGVVADWVRNAVYFDVFDADVFGSGNLPPTTHGRVLVEQRWDMDPGGSEAA